jgi:hypothetical protein
LFLGRGVGEGEGSVCGSVRLLGVPARPRGVVGEGSCFVVCVGCILVAAGVDGVDLGMVPETERLLPVVGIESVLTRVPGVGWRLKCTAISVKYEVFLVLTALVISISWVAVQRSI